MDKIKIKEFQWYQVETKVRQIMGQLLQPFNKKQTQDTVKLNQLKRALATLTKRVEDHDFLMDRENSQKPTYLQLQDDKIQQILQKQTQSILQSDAKIKKMQTILAIYQQKINQLNDLQKRLDSEIIQRQKQFRNHRDSIDRTLQSFTKRQQSQIQQASMLKASTKTALAKAQTRMIGFDNRLRQLQDNFRQRNNDVKRLQEDVNSLMQRAGLIQNLLIDLKNRIQDRQRQGKLAQKFLMMLKQLKNDFQFVSRYLQQYQPLYTQMIISQTMDAVFQGKMRRKLCLYEQQRFAKLHQAILLDERRSLADMMADYSNHIRRITTRNRKYVIDLTVSQSIQLGTNIYQFRLENGDNVNQNPQPIQKPVQQPQYNIQNIVKQVQISLKHQIEQIVNPTRTWIKQIQQQSLLRLVQQQKRWNQLKSKVQESLTKSDLIQKYVNSSFNKLSHKTDQIQDFVIVQKQLVRDLLNFSSVINHIVIQDQIDRQGTALYALKGKQEGAPPTIKLDPNCSSCQNRQIQHAFKVACLTYNPSLITIDNQPFSRQQILQISTAILQKLKKKIQPQKINKKINVETKNYGTLQPPDRQIQDNRITRIKNRSNSNTKQSKNGLRNKLDPPNLLPILGNMTSKQRKTHLSVFY